jgi:uncharacterized protein (DUF433 family)
LTRVLEQAVERLPPDEQDAIAALILEAIQDGQGWGEGLTDSEDELAQVAEETREGVRARRVKDANREDLAAVERTFDPYRLAKIMQLAVREALLRHKQAGNPIAVWRNGRVEWIQPEDIPVDGPEDHPEDLPLQCVEAETPDFRRQAMSEALIISSPSVMMGKPVVAGTRITVDLILEKLGSGESIEALLESHPRLTREGVMAALRFAAQAVRAEATRYRKT